MLNSASLNRSRACTHASTSFQASASIAGDADGDASAVRAGAVFPEKDALPGSEVALAVFDGDRERGQRQDRPDVGRHVVGSFAVVPEGWIAVGHQFGGELFQIVTNGRIGVLADDERCAGVVNEDVSTGPGRSSIARRLAGSAA